MSGGLTIAAGGDTAAAMVGSAPRGLTLIAIYLAGCGFALSPLLWASVPPLVDYPNHLARMWVLTHGDSIPALAGNYLIHWRILPYMAMDAVVVALSWLMPVELAGRVFVALAMLSLVGGTVALHRALHGRVGLWPLASLLFVYNFVLFFGFLSCLFALGLSLFAFAGWVATRSWPPLARVALFALVACVLLLAHLFAFGVYGLLVASHEAGSLLAGRRLSWRAAGRVALAGAQFGPALLLGAAAVAQGVPSHTEYGGIGVKIIALLAPFNFSLIPHLLDRSMAVCAMAFLLFALMRPRLRLVPAMRLPLLTLGVAALLMPNWLGGSWGVDLRLPITLPFVVIASTRLEGLGRRSRALLAAAAGGLLLLRVATASQAFADYDRWFGEFRGASAVIPPGARLLVVEAPLELEQVALPGLPLALGSIQAPLFTHMPALAVIDRSAFLPYLFSGFTTIDVAPANRRIAQLIATEMTPQLLADSADPAELGKMAQHTNQIGEHPYWHDWPNDFDYLFWMSFLPTPRPTLTNLQEVAHGSYFSVYRILR